MAELAGETNVPVVMPNDPEARVLQRLDKGHRPRDQLHAQAHNKQDSWLVTALPFSRVFYLNVNAICSNFHS